MTSNADGPCVLRYPEQWSSVNEGRARAWRAPHILTSSILAYTLPYKVLRDTETATGSAGRTPVHREGRVKKWLRRIRGAIGMGLTWAIAWFAAGMILLLIVGPDAADVPFPLGFGMFGFLAGVTFSGVLGLIDGRRRFDQMSLPRFAGWGAVGGLLLSATFVLAAGLGGDLILILGPVFAMSSAACAAGSLALARMAEDQDSLGTFGRVDDALLSKGEARDP